MRKLTCPEEAETIGLKPDEWFPVRRYLDALNELARTTDFTVL